MKLSFYLLAIFGCCLLVLSSCEVETEFLTGESVELRFSTDTLTFDTVFAARGSATRQFKVYNDGDQPVMIDRIRIAGQTGVSYSFNIDGTAGPEAEDVVIFGNDSIFVFVEVEVDPTEPENTSPFVAEDQMIFELGTIQETVTLLAFGQNAIYFGLDLAARGNFFSFPCDMGEFTLTNDLPYVLFGSWVVSDCVLRAEPGTRIYVHGGVQRNDNVGGNGFFNDGILIVEESGQLDFRGTLEEPVIIATDRLEEEFLDDPAKYRGIILSAGSRGNRLEYTRILNSIVGITLDSAASLILENSVIAYSGGSAISAFDANVTLRNSVFHSNFGNALQFIRGGNLLMEYSTIANYGVDASSLVLTNVDCPDGQPCSASLLRATIRNSIISGSRGSELIFFDVSQEP
ncbi:MAG: right-handed parallel beta-helix repeat-containing protein, partial [Bacteroidota bacterium]